MALNYDFCVLLQNSLRKITAKSDNTHKTKQIVHFKLYPRIEKKELDMARESVLKAILIQPTAPLNPNPKVLTINVRYVFLIMYIGQDRPCELQG